MSKISEFFEKRRIIKDKKREEKSLFLLQKKIDALKRGKLAKKGKIGLCLGGGGARGYAHIGALLALEEAGVKFDLCAGTSVGALVGGLYSAGVTVSDMVKMGEKLQVKDIWSKSKILAPSEPIGVEKIITDLVGDIDFSDTRIPFCAVATDLVSAREVVLHEGNLAKGVSASCCIPIVFKPVIIDDMHLVDGGLVNNIPVDVCKAMGADYVIAIDVNPTRVEGTNEVGRLAVLKTSYSIVMSHASQKSYYLASVMIKADTSAFSMAKKDGYEKMIEIGYNQAKNAISEIVTKIYSDKIYK